MLFHPFSCCSGNRSENCLCNVLQHDK